MNISDKNHPHHAVWREHVQSVLDGEPKVVLVKAGELDDWTICDVGVNGVSACAWIDQFKYRIKPRTITRTITYPEPMKVAPEAGKVFYVINPSNEEGFSRCVWSDYGWAKYALKCGACFATEADAKAAAQAIFGIES